MSGLRKRSLASVSPGGGGGGGKEGYYCICFYFKISVQKSVCQKTHLALDMHYILNTHTFSITINIITGIFGP